MKPTTHLVTYFIFEFQQGKIFSGYNTNFWHYIR